MQNKSTFERVRDVLIEELGSPAASVDENTKLTDIGSDSMSNIEMAFSLEDAFDIEIQDSQLSDVKTVGDLVNLVEECIADK